MSAVSLTITPSAGSAYTLAQSPGRLQDGTPLGPDNMDFRTDKGTLDREPIGADGVETEAVGCDRRVLTFSVQRVYASASAALTGFAGLEAACPSKGAIALGGSTLIAAATLRSLAARLKGRNVSAVYTFEGY
jgi:hypothetical protein